MRCLQWDLETAEHAQKLQVVAMAIAGYRSPEVMSNETGGGMGEHGGGRGIGSPSMTMLWRKSTEQLVETKLQGQGAVAYLRAALSFLALLPDNGTENDRTREVSHAD
jgi:hypothetical protein